MAKSRPAGISALRCVVPPLCALIQASRLIGRHCQCSRSLGIAASDGSLSFGPGQGSLGGKSGTSEQHGEQDTKHKAHDVTPSWLSGLPHKAAHGTDQLLLRSFRLGSPKLRRHHCIGSNAHFDRCWNRHRKHCRSAQPMSLLGQKRTNHRGQKSTFVRC